MKRHALPASLLLFFAFLSAACTSKPPEPSTLEQLLRALAQKDGVQTDSVTIHSIRESKEKKGVFLAKAMFSGKCLVSDSSADMSDLTIESGLGPDKRWQLLSPKTLWFLCLPDTNSILTMILEKSKGDGKGLKDLSAVIQETGGYVNAGDYVSYRVQIVKDNIVGVKGEKFRVSGSDVVGDKTIEMNRITTVHEARLSRTAAGEWTMQIMPAEKTDAETYSSIQTEAYSRTIAR